MVSIAKTFEFAASHRLFREEWTEEKNQQVFGKCYGQHGHNYRLEVVVSGPISQDTGMVIDASLISSIVQEKVYLDVDHKDLNTDVAWLKGQITTVENFIEAIWGRLEQPFKQQGVQLQKLILWETGRIYAIRDAN